MEAHQPHWSPDGKQIAFMAVYPDSRYKMCLISPDGGEYQEVFPGGGQEGAPTWSKDGKKLVYGDVFSRQDSSNMSIHVFDLTSRNASTLPQSSGLWSPRWSPDGRYISAVAVGSPPAVLLYDCTSQKWTRLATVDTIDDEPTWSGDSAYIYFISSDSGLSRYYRVRIGDGRTEPLISLPGNSLDPWGGVTPDGVPLVSRINRVQEIYAMHVEWP